MAFYSAPGYRFHPTEEELVNHYLRLKMSGCDDEVTSIAELNVCDFEPWELPNKAVIQSDDQVWYFFCPRICKYSNSQRASRTTRAGYWKITGKDRKIRTESTEEEIAVKKTLVFYEGRVPTGVKTSWVMHEYHPTFSLRNQRNYVICKIKRNADDVSISEKGESSSQMSLNYTENQSQYPNISVEDDFQMQAHLESFHGYNVTDYSLSATMPFQMQSSSSENYSGAFGYGSYAPRNDHFYGYGRPQYD